MLSTYLHPTLVCTRVGSLVRIFADGPCRCSKSVLQREPFHEWLSGWHNLSRWRAHGFELHHRNNSGTTKRFGIVVQNSNNTAVTLTLHNKAIGAASGTSQQAEQQRTAIMVRDYLKSSSSTITVPANPSVFVLSQNVSNGYMVDGKLSMTSNKGHVYAQIVYGSTTPSADTYVDF